MLDQVFELFISLNATDEQLDFPFIYASAKDGYAKVELEHVSGTMEPLFDAIVKHIPPPRAHAGDGFQMLVANLDYRDYLGRIAFGKIYSGKVKVGDPAVCLHGDGRKTKPARSPPSYHFEGLKRIEVQEAHAGDIVGLTGFEDVFIGETIARHRGPRRRCPTSRLIRRPSRCSSPSTTARSPAQDGKLVTARHIWERLREGNPHQRRPPHRADRATRRSSTSAAAAKCRSPSWSSRCAAKATKCWSPARRSSIAKDADGNLLEPIEKLFLEIPKEYHGRRSWRTSPAAKPRSPT